MKLEVGKTYLTRDGRKARVICIDMDSVYSVAAVIRNKECETLDSYTMGGRFHEDGTASGSDLVSEYREPLVRWAVINRHNLLTNTFVLEEAARAYVKDIAPGARVAKFIEVIE